jgi:acyl carrier protein
LKQREVSIDENFFDIGGNSFLLIRMRDILEKEFDINLKMSDLLSNVTIKELSALIRNMTAIEISEVNNSEKSEEEFGAENDVAK